MKPKSALVITAATLAGVIVYLLTAAGQADESTAPAYVTTIPAGYRDWKVVSVAHEEGKLHSLGIVLGNDVAIKALLPLSRACQSYRLDLHALHTLIVRG